MKIILLVSLIALAGCSGSQSEFKVTSGDYKLPNRFSILVIDRCEYLYVRGGNGEGLSHKGNCNNPEHGKVHK